MAKMEMDYIEIGKDRANFNSSFNAIPAKIAKQ